MTAPTRITADGRRLCARLGRVEEPGFVPVRPRLDSGEGDCFVDVARQVAECSGSAQHGWLVWQFPGVLIEAEFHAVWRQPDGTLLDVSTKPDGESQVLFVPDPVRQFCGERVFTVHQAVGRDPRIREFIALASRFQRLLAQRYRGRFGVEIVADPDLEQLDRRKRKLELELLTSREARRAAS